MEAKIYKLPLKRYVAPVRPPEPTVGEALGILKNALRRAVSARLGRLRIGSIDLMP